MSNFQDAIQDLKNYALKQRAIVDIIPHLERIASIEGDEAEVRAKLGTVSTEYSATKQKLDEANAALKNTAERTDRMLNEAQDRANSIVAQARAEGEAERKRIVDSAQAEVHAKMQEKREVEEKIARAEVQREAAIESLAAKNRELAEVEARIAALKDSVKSLLSR